MKLTKNERACLEGARRLAETDQLIGPTTPAGLKAIRSLAKKGLLELVGWTHEDIAKGTPLYKITLDGRSELGHFEGLFAPTLPVSR